MQSILRAYHITSSLPCSASFSLLLQKQCCACNHGSAAAQPFSAIPGPKPWPIIGNTLEMGANREQIDDYFFEGFKKYGNVFKLTSFGNRFLVIKDPDAIEQVLRAEGKYPARDIMLTDALYWLKTNKTKLPAAFAEQTNGKDWKRLRSAVGKQATPRNVQSYCGGFNQIFGRFIDHIRNTRGKDGVMDDITTPLKLLLIEISAKFVFDNDINVVGNPRGDYKDFVSAINNLFDVFGRLQVELPLYKLYNNQVARTYQESLAIVERISRQEVERLYARLEAGEESETPGLLEQWLREGKISEEQAIAEAIGTFSAGVDTTSNQSAFLLYLMAKHPEAQEKLHQEVWEVMGGDSKHPTPQQLSQMPFMKGCILESFRLLSTADIFSRVTAEDTILHGYNIPAKTTVLYSIYCAGRDEALFRDPLKFDPERWSRDDRHAFAIQPFGFGPRMCYGRRFAELEMKLLLVQTVLNFKLTTPIEELKTICKGTVMPDGDLPIKFLERDEPRAV